MSANTQLVTAQVAQTLRSTDMQQQMGRMLPPGVPLDKFTEVTIAAISNSPDVLEADRDSLYRACVAAARRGLLPDKKEGALVIYNTNVGTRDKPAWMKLVQFLPMVEGIIKEMAKAGIKAYAVSVYENDTISFWNDDEGQHVRHEPQVFGDRGEMVGVFAAAKTEDGRPYVEAMSLKDIGQVARRSKQCHVDERTGEVKFGGTWRSDFDRMGQKSALHRLRKRLPIADEDALQNLKDMEETTDIELNATQPQPAQGATPDPGTAQPSSPSPEHAALPAPGQQADAIDLKKLRTPRKSKVLQGVMAANGSTGAVAQQQSVGASHDPKGAGATPAGTPKATTSVAQNQPGYPEAGHSQGDGRASSQGKVAGSTPAGSHQQQPEPEYSDDDIV